MNIATLLRAAANPGGRQGRDLQTGSISGTEAGRYLVTVNGNTHQANAGFTGLKVGDVVWVLMDRGTPKIVGLLGPNEDNTL